MLYLSDSQILVQGHYSGLSQRLLGFEKHVGRLLLSYHKLNGNHLFRLIDRYAFECNEFEPSIKVSNLKLTPRHNFYFAVLNDSYDRRLYII